MKLELKDFVRQRMVQPESSSGGGLELQMNVGITSWPEIELEVSDHFYVIFW
jgi:hypothetical protein